MGPRLVTLDGKRLVGVRERMSLTADRTRALWQRYMPRRGEIRNRVDTNYVSMQVHDRPPDQGFTPDTSFEKWAAVEVTDLERVPAGMEGYAVPAGRYAVFVHKGPASTFDRTLHYIFRVWLPASDYVLDHRAHFTVMAEDYRPDASDTEEEVWIPICTKPVHSHPDAV
jgi:AraC family transcriptional regulator